DRADVLELADDGLCCGAGGAYSLVHPDLAEVVRARKVEAIRSTTADRGEVVVASANPGCSMFLAAAGLRVRHPVDIVRDSLVDGPTRTGAEHG
ncbi:MAG: heterodisulfide reductase-related iron-sulfur binding cluster, partial [Actinomycetes bacterium]